VSNFIQILPVRELILSTQEVTPHQSRSGKGRCHAAATTRKSVCWRLKKHPNLATANFVSLWLLVALDRSDMAS
jgi:hypothetical protein